MKVIRYSFFTLMASLLFACSNTEQGGDATGHSEQQNNMLTTNGAKKYASKTFDQVLALQTSWSFSDGTTRGRWAINFSNVEMQIDGFEIGTPKTEDQQIIQININGPISEGKIRPLEAGEISSGTNLDEFSNFNISVWDHRGIDPKFVSDHQSGKLTIETFDSKSIKGHGTAILGADTLHLKFDCPIQQLK